MQIQTIPKGVEPFESDSKHLNTNSNHPKGIWSIRIQIQTFRKRFEAF